MANTKKAGVKKVTSKTITPTPRTIAQQFEDVAECYGTDDPEIIKQKIMWMYISLLAQMAQVNVAPGKRTHMENHMKHFDVCNKFIEEQCQQHEALQNSSERRLATINALVVELYKAFGDDYKDLCRSLITDGSRLKYSMLWESVNDLFGIASKR